MHLYYRIMENLPGRNGGGIRCQVSYYQNLAVVVSTHVCDRVENETVKQTGIIQISLAGGTGFLVNFGIKLRKSLSKQNEL
jgi:hypothetical protein